METNNLNFDL